MTIHHYELIDSGNGRKFERFGPYFIVRPCSQAVWVPQLPQSEWNKADAIFSRDQENKWTFQKKLPDVWEIEVSNVRFKISPTGFGHLGVFPEQKASWEWIQETLKPHAAKKPKVLNLFAYSGGSTLASAKAGGAVCHLDASKGMVTWARENAALNQLENAPIRWIVEDVKKFLKRELKRGSHYEGIILDPPSFGHGSKGELFKIEEDITALLEDCYQLLSDKPLFVLFSCHAPGFSPIVMEQLLKQSLKGFKGKFESGEMVLSGKSNVFAVPSGTFARWSA